MQENIKTLSSVAKEMLNSGRFENVDDNKLNLLFPFFEEVLGYDTTNVGDVIIAPAYTNDGSFKLDYGLRGAKAGTYKSCIKVVNRGSAFSDVHEKIKECISTIECEFIIVTDCFDYEFLVFDEVKNELINIGSFSIVDPENHDISMITLIKSPPKARTRQDYAVDNEDEANTYNQYIEESENSEANEVGIYDDKRLKKKTKQKSKKKISAVSIIIPVLIGIIIILAIFVLGNKNLREDIFSNIPIIGDENKINRYELQGKIEALVDDENGIIKVSFFTDNIPSGGVVKFDVVSGTNKDFFYSEVDTTGSSIYQYTIPKSWDNPEITLIASLRFDETDYPQPGSVKTYFGEVGEKIIEKDGAPDRFSITFTKVVYDGEAVKLRDEEAERLKAEEERLKRIELLSNFEIQFDSFGNWKVVPKKFDMNEVNITESRNIYPQIFYDGEEKQAYFYIVAGTFNQMSLLRFTDVIFYADGYQWNYEVSSNTKKISVDNGIAKEWVYFDNINTPNLVADSKLLGESNTSKIVFKGDKIKEHAITNNEKQSLLDMIEIFNLYFNTLDGPNPEWIEELKE